MGFKRSSAPSEAPEQQRLTEAMAGIGLGFAARRARDPNIEDTLLHASVEAMLHDDLRVLAVLVTWFGVHHERVNADRMTKLAADQPDRVRALWSSLGRWQLRDRRWRKMVSLYDAPRLDLLTASTDFQLRRHGEDARFEGSVLRVPANVLRDRPSDVSAPSDLARYHRPYRYRLMMGPGFRADCWAALERSSSLTASQLARATYSSFATAWQVKRDFAMLTPAHTAGARDAPS